MPLLDVFGTFTVVGQGGCPAQSHIIATHPALMGTTDATLSNWGCSTHEGFDSWPADWLVLAISLDVLSTFVAPDGTSGAPYIIAQGETLSPVLCGDGILDPTEECDDGNTDNGDGCSAQCKVEIPICGDGTLDPGEECDDGNTDNGDGCSAVCELENENPDCSAAAADPWIVWPPNHQGVDIAIIGLSDPDGDPVTVIPTAVMQDEPVLEKGSGSGSTSPDASLSPLQVRAERNGNKKTPGDGRVYHISFTADDGNGGSCSGTVRVCIPHDMGQSSECVDGGPLYDSLQP